MSKKTKPDVVVVKDKPRSMDLVDRMITRFKKKGWTAGWYEAEGESCLLGTAVITEKGEIHNPNSPEAAEYKWDTESRRLIEKYPLVFDSMKDEIVERANKSGSKAAERFLDEELSKMPTKAVVIDFNDDVLDSRGAALRFLRKVRTKIATKVIRAGK